jgi:phage repressor protein C with HTH and peptisase S24 domain
LSGETDDPSENYIPVPSTEVVAEEMGLVQVRELDLTLGMGATYLDVPVTETVRLFPRDWLRLYTRSDPEHLVFVNGVGDSMEPTLRDSDLLLIDTAQKTLNISEKIWALTYADCGAVKRLRPVPGGGIAMMSDNPNVSDQIAYDGELHLLGRVVAVIRKM